MPGDESVVDLASSDWLMLWSSGCASSSSSFCMLTGKKDGRPVLDCRSATLAASYLALSVSKELSAAKELGRVRAARVHK